MVILVLVEIVAVGAVEHVNQGFAGRRQHIPNRGIAVGEPVQPIEHIRGFVVLVVVFVFGRDFLVGPADFVLGIRLDFPILMAVVAVGVAEVAWRLSVGILDVAERKLVGGVSVVVGAEVPSEHIGDDSRTTADGTVGKDSLILVRTSRQHFVEHRSRVACGLGGMAEIFVSNVLQAEIAPIESDTFFKMMIETAFERCRFRSGMALLSLE